MTVKRLTINWRGLSDRESAPMLPSENGDYVYYADAKRDIERLGNELFATRAQLHALEKQRAADIACKDELIAALHERIRRAGMELGFADPEEFRT